MPTAYSTRSKISSGQTLYDDAIAYDSSISYAGLTFGTPYNLTRIGGEYMVTSEGDYITDSYGNRIMVLVAGGHLPYTQYTTRPLI